MAVVTTGFFDGVHLGHREVIKTLVSSARERGEEAVVVTFWPHPRTVLQQDAREFRILTTLQEKKELLLGLGVDRVEVIPFTRAFAAMTAREYLSMLRERYGATRIIMGYDNRLGSDRISSTNMPDLVDGTPVLCLSSTDKAVSVDGTPVSSTGIRKMLSEGNPEGAQTMLGYRYGLCGAVVAGNRLGRTIGFPTANMQLYEPLKLIPGNGVYAVEVEVLGAKWRGMTNIGFRPTVGGSTRTVETHILDFDEDIYGLPLTITFLRKLRDEIHFPSLEALKGQLAKDREACACLQGFDGQ